MEGGFELPIQGQPTRTLKAGDAFQIPPETPHAGGKAGDAKSRILITYVVEKGKPCEAGAQLLCRVVLADHLTARACPGGAHTRRRRRGCCYVRGADNAGQRRTGGGQAEGRTGCRA